MNKIKLLWLIVAVLAVAGVWYLSSQRNDGNQAGELQATSTQEAASLEPSGSMTPTGNSTGSATMMTTPEVAVTVTLTDNGFAPGTITVKKGQTVKWINQSNSGMWVASAIHPSHAVYSGTTLQEHCQNGTYDAFDQCASGDEYTFVFNKIGTWNYHNHVSARETGTVTVTQ